MLGHYREHGRDLPWRQTRDAYAILVSEVMLQQTQVSRVLPKYQEFLETFPTIHALATAPVAAVLTAWQGLGYNRRALNLQRAAQVIVRDHRGVVPHSPAALQSLPGIGPATAAAVCTFAFDAPAPFIETNIRAAFIHFFFQECVSVPDAAILPLVELTLDRDDPCRWFYALMDYGVWVKKHFANPGRRSRHHAPQSPFAGSHRQLRAMILGAVLAAAPMAVSTADVLEALDASRSSPPRAALPAQAQPGQETVAAVLDELCAEGFVVKTNTGYAIA